MPQSITLFLTYATTFVMFVHLCSRSWMETLNTWS
jgi:hypothetical protein